MRRIITV